MAGLNGAAAEASLKLRYQLMPLAAAEQATAAVTAFVRFAHARFDDPVFTVRELAALALDDPGRPLPLVTKSYIAEELEALVRSPLRLEEAGKAASRALRAITEAEQEIGIVVGDAAGFILARRLIRDIIPSVPAQVLIDCVAAGTKGGGSSDCVMVPLGDGVILREAFLGFVAEIAVRPWTRQAYSSLIASAFVTAGRRLGVGDWPVDPALAQVFRMPSSGMPRHAWPAMPDGSAAAVPEIVDDARELARAIVSLVECEGSLKVAFAFAAAALSPIPAVDLSRRISSLEKGFAGDMPERLGEGQLALLLSGAPAVVV